MNHLQAKWANLVRESGSWRPLTAPGEESFFRDFDAVIATDAQGAGSRGNTYEVYTYGEIIAETAHLDEAKAAVEDVYGPLPWRRVQMPKADVVHRYFGPTNEFTDPMTIYVVDRLPQL